MIPDPVGTFTHAITIGVGPARVWPWLAQMGAGRAGWYAFDPLLNGGRPSAGILLPELLVVRPGTVFPVVPGATTAFTASTVRRDRDLVLTVPGPSGRPRMTWELLLERRPGGRCRLVARTRVARGWLEPDSRGRVRKRGSNPPVSAVERAGRLVRRAPTPVAEPVMGLAQRAFQVSVLRGVQRRALRFVEKDTAPARPRWVERLFPAAAVAERSSAARGSSGMATHG
jgi:hypothetical protein